MASTKKEVVAQIVAKGYSEEEAFAKFDEVLSRKSDPALEGIIKFLEQQNHDPETLDATFVVTQIDSILSKGGAPMIDADPYTNDLTGKKAPVAENTSSVTTTEFARPILDKPTNDLIASMLDDQAIQTRTATTRNTSIEVLLLQRPNPSTYLVKDGQPLQVIVEVDADKMATYESQIDTTDPKNVQNFNAVKAAWQNKTPLDVYVNDDSNRRIIGTILNVAGERRTLSISGLKGFLFTDVLGRIAGKPGVILSRWEDKVSRSKSGSISSSVATLSIKWAGRDSAIKEGMVDYISAPCTPEKATAMGFDSTTEEARLRIAIPFTCSVHSTRLAKMIKRTKRLTGRGTVPRFILRDQFSGLFEEPRRKDYIDMPSTPEELTKALASIDIGLAAIASGDFKPTGDMLQNARLNEIVAKIRQASATGATAGSNDLTGI